MTHSIRPIVVTLLAAIVYPATSLDAQSTADRVERDVTGEFSLGPKMLIVDPWRIQIAARRDGWVELVLESVPGVTYRMPGVVSQIRTGAEEYSPRKTAGEQGADLLIFAQPPA